MAAGAGAQASTRQAWVAAALLTAVALLFRFPHFGNPSLHMDEEFYLLVGDRVLHGELPYVDFWDRKPVGLFLIYAAIRLLGGNGIWAYQLVATGFAIATAFVIRSMARRWAGELGSVLAGVAYLATLEALGGGGGQSPVFYNLFMALAAQATLQSYDRNDLRPIFSKALVAMAFCGIAIQIKYSVIFEGAFFGLLLLNRFRQAGDSLGGIAWRGAAMIMVALLPTLAAAGYFVAIGQGPLFWFTNFQSILQRRTTGSSLSVPRMGFLGIALLPLIAADLIGWAQRNVAVRSGPAFFLLGWIAAAVIGFGILGNYFNHYALPLALPLAVAAARALDRPPLNVVLTTLAIVVPLALMGYPDLKTTQEAEAVNARLAEVVRQNLKGGCLFAYDGPPILYYLTGACHPTRYVFPQHLNYLLEEHAIGVDTAVETRRILVTRPTVIVTSNTPISDPNEQTKAILRASLVRDYHLVARMPFAGRDLLVYALNASRGSAAAAASTARN